MGFGRKHLNLSRAQIDQDFHLLSTLFLLVHSYVVVWEDHLCYLSGYFRTNFEHSKTYKENTGSMSYSLKNSNLHDSTGVNNKLIVFILEVKYLNYTI